MSKFGVRNLIKQSGSLAFINTKVGTEGLFNVFKD